MLSRFLLLVVVCTLALSAARAQSRQEPAPALHYRASELLRAGLTLPAGPPAASRPAGAMPTVRAAAAYTPLHRSARQSLPVDTLPPAPRHDLTGVQAAPPYDLYQNLPEEFRKRTLPAPWAEPLPLQLLRGALGR